MSDIDVDRSETQKFIGDEIERNAAIKNLKPHHSPPSQMPDR